MSFIFWLTVKSLTPLALLDPYKDKNYSFLYPFLPLLEQATLSVHHEILMNRKPRFTITMDTTPSDLLTDLNKKSEVRQRKDLTEVRQTKGERTKGHEWKSNLDCREMLMVWGGMNSKQYVCVCVCVCLYECIWEEKIDRRGYCQLY